MARGFKDLEIWQLGFNCLRDIYRITDNFPQEEKFVLSSQLRRSANAIIAGIAESHGRYHFADKIRILYIARGEIEETRSHLEVALFRKYITLEEFQKIDEDYQVLIKRVNAYINSLREQKRTTNSSVN